MGIFWKKNKVNVGKHDYSTKNLAIEQREEIIALREDGLKPSEIAADIGIDVKRVCKVLELERRKASGSNKEEDPIRKMNVELKILELQQKKNEMQWESDDRKAERAADLAGDVGDLDQDDPMTAMMTGFMTQLMNKSPSPGAVENVPTPVVEQSAQVLIDLSQEDMEKLLDQYPKQVKAVQKLSDQGIMDLIGSYFPQLSEKSKTLALETIKKKQIEV